MSILICIIILLVILIFIKLYSINPRKIHKGTRQCFDNKMTNSERETLKRLVVITDNILSSKKILWMPTGGSLLSIYRTNKLFLKWDDDYDMTVENSKTKEAVKILKNELPKYNASLHGPKPWGGGSIYRICFNDSEKGIIKSRNKNETWPLIDLFIDVPHRKCNFRPHNITDEEISLSQKYYIEGIVLNLPITGTRSRNEFKLNGHIDTCIEQSFNHKNGRYETCIGVDKMECSKLDLNY
jgi:hypothetical protein